MGEVTHEAEVNSSREALFAYVNDYRNVPEYFFGVSRFEPVTEQTEGLGSKFETVLKVGPKELKSTVECTGWVENEQITLESVSGFGADTDWRFTEGSTPGTTRLSVRFGYRLPGGLTGRVLAGLIGPFADQAVKHIEGRIRAAVEEN